MRLKLLSLPYLIARWRDRRRNRDAEGQYKPFTRRERAKLLGWATLAALFVGYTGIGTPLDELMVQLRAMVRMHKVDSPYVIVARDDKSAQAMGGYDYSRKYDAQLIDKLFAMGAKRVFFDRVYPNLTTPDADNAFAAALARHKGKVFLGKFMREDAKTGRRVQVVPNAKFRRVAGVVSLDGTLSPIFAYTPLNVRLGANSTMPSMSNMLSDRHLPGTNLVYPDFSINSRGFNVVSLSDLLRVDQRLDLRSKDVVVAATSSYLNDMHFTITQNFAPGINYILMNAETLKYKYFCQIDWKYILLFYIFVEFFLLYVFQFFKRPPIYLFLFIVLPFLTEYFAVEYQLVPGMLFVFLVGRRVRLVTCIRKDKATGLPSIQALSEFTRKSPAAVICLRLSTIGGLDGGMATGVPAMVLVDIARQLKRARKVDRCFVVENMLVWLISEDEVPTIEAFCAEIRAVVIRVVHGAAIAPNGQSPSVSFGVDVVHGSAIGVRARAAVRCATEAAARNVLLVVNDREREQTRAWERQLLAGFNQALETGAIWVAFQPQYDLHADEVLGAEAMARWTLADGQSVEPDRFIALLEEHNYIEEMTRFVLSEAVRCAAPIAKREPRFRVSVNISAQMLSWSQLPVMVMEALLRHKMAPAQLCLEITETGQVARSPQALALIEQLRGLGVHMSIDDYGTGRATLDYLKLLPADEIKVDRQFITNLAENIDDQVMVRSTIALAHSLQRSVVAEGVETPECLAILRTLGCDVIQGYLISKPLRASDFHAFMAAPHVRNVA